MKTAYVIRAMREANENGSKDFHKGDYKGAVECHQKALYLCSSLPADIEFDKARFEAFVYADLSAAFGRQGKHMDSFAAANKALAFFDTIPKKLGNMEISKYLMAQVNQGTALAALGCFPAALEALDTAKNVFTDKGLDALKNKQWLDIVEDNITAIKDQIEKQQQPQPP